MESQNENKIRNYAQKLEKRLFTTKLSTNANSLHTDIFHTVCIKMVVYKVTCLLQEVFCLVQLLSILDIATPSI